MPENLFCTFFCTFPSEILNKIFGALWKEKIMVEAAAVLLILEFQASTCMSWWRFWNNSWLCTSQHCVWSVPHKAAGKCYEPPDCPLLPPQTVGSGLFFILYLYIYVHKQWDRNAGAVVSKPLFHHNLISLILQKQAREVEQLQLLAQPTKFSLWQS